MYSYTKDPTRITRFLRFWLLASIVIAITTIFSSNTQIRQLAAGSPVKNIAASGSSALLYLLDCIIGLIAGVCFLRWIYIATMNCRGFGARGMFCNPGQAVGYYFMPLYCLYKPYYSLKEIWLCSQNPVHWKGMKGSPAIISWWILLLVSSFYSETDQCTPVTASGLSSVLVSSLYTKSMHIGMCLLAIYMVTSIQKMQEAWIHQQTEAQLLDESPA